MVEGLFEDGWRLWASSAILYKPVLSASKQKLQPKKLGVYCNIKKNRMILISFTKGSCCIVSRLGYLENCTIPFPLVRDLNCCEDHVMHLF